VASIHARVEPEPYKLGQQLWEYLRVRNEQPEVTPGGPADTLIMVLGSPDFAVAEHAADLLVRGVADKAVVSGGCPLPGTSPPMLEADKIADLMAAKGISVDRLLRERQSQNTTDHFWKTEQLLRGRPDVAGGENPPKFVILVPTPIAERRALATGRFRWWRSQIRIDGIPESYGHYMKRMETIEPLGQRVALSRMVGEIQRILLYPQLEWMTEPDEAVPADVLEAYRSLKPEFDGRLVADRPSMRVPVPA
jgi:uncharacterized SAM-binding protein YcdF (DUF218 family)